MNEPTNRAAAFDRAIDLAGGSYVAVARRFNLRTGFGVSKWRAEGVPAERVLELAGFTGFRVTPHELRPDLYPNPTDGLPPDFVVSESFLKSLQQGKAA